MKTRTMVCVECGSRLFETTPGKARKLGWTLWDGGGRCAICERKRDQAEAAKIIPPTVERRRVIVACASCSKELNGIEMEPGVFWPSIHWLTTVENKRRLREEKRPIPFCPGIKMAAKVVDQQGASA